MVLALALQRLQRRGVIADDPLRHQVAAVSVGLVAGEALLDLAYVEDSRADVDLNVVGNGSGDLLEIQGTAEGAPFSRARLDTLLTLAEGGLQTLMTRQREALAAAPTDPDPETV